MMRKLISCGIIAIAGAVVVMLARNKADSVNDTDDETKKNKRHYGPPPRRRDTSDDTSEEIYTEPNTVECKSSSCDEKFENEHGMKIHYGRIHEE